jgi:DNA-binding IclR family transcriptional regulator
MFMQETKKGHTQLHTVERALRVLSIFAEERSQLSLHEISGLLEMPKSMVFRILQTLESMGYIIKDEKSKNYTLGLEAFRVGKVFERNLYIKRISLPFMQELNFETKETVELVVPDLRIYRPICIHTMESHHSIKPLPEMGTVGYFHCGAPRKAIFAYLGEEMIEQVIHRIGLPKLTQHTHTNPGELREHLRTIRNQGFAISREEAIPGACSVAAPIFNSLGGVAGSVGINLPLYRINEDKEKELEHMVKLYCSRISEQLGYQPK